MAAGSNLYSSQTMANLTLCFGVLKTLIISEEEERKHCRTESVIETTEVGCGLENFKTRVLCILK